MNSVLQRFKRLGQGFKRAEYTPNVDAGGKIMRSLATGELEVAEGRAEIQDGHFWLLNPLTIPHITRELLNGQSSRHARTSNELDLGRFH